MYVVYINLLYFLSIFLFTYNKNLLSQKTPLCRILDGPLQPPPPPEFGRVWRACIRDKYNIQLQ